MFGGTFNPIHIGHLVAAQETFHSLTLDEIIFLPTGNPPHRNEPNVGIKARVEMTRRAIQNNAQFSLSEHEASSDDVSYTIDTMRHFNETTDSNTSTYFITGADELINFKEWKDWEALLESTTVVGMSRPEFDPSEIPQVVRSKIQFVDIPKIEVSSTTIRNRLRKKQPARYFLPTAVWDYIHRHDLYQSGSDHENS